MFVCLGNARLEDALDEGEAVPLQEYTDQYTEEYSQGEYHDEYQVGIPRKHFREHFRIFIFVKRKTLENPTNIIKRLKLDKTDSFCQN